MQPCLLVAKAVRSSIYGFDGEIIQAMTVFSIF